MIDTSRRAAALWALIATASFATAIPAFSQAPTDAQRSAIRSACRADYEAHCASVPPGGMASLQCLQKNMSSLAPGCQSAVRAVEATAGPKADTNKADTAAPTEPAAKPAAEAPAAAAPPKAAAATPAKNPSSAQVAAIRSACRADYQRNCASVPPGGAASLKCLEQNKAKLSASCQQAVNAAGGGATPAASGAATATPAAAPATMALRPMRPREELFVLRSACGPDVRALCGGIPVGGGRIARCLAGQAASLSPACKEVLSSFAAR